MKKAGVQHRILMIILMIVLAAVAFPFYWMLLSSFTPRTVLFQPPYKFFRLDLSVENYRDLFFATEFLTYMKNSVIAAIGAILLNVFVVPH